VGEVERPANGSATKLDQQLLSVVGRRRHPPEHQVGVGTKPRRGVHAPDGDPVGELLEERRQLFGLLLGEARTL
jgi:hypothetical protein